MQPVTFDGLSGSINITQKGSLGSICEAYYHKDIIANILSVSAIRSQGHTLEYENESDSFFLSYSCGQSIFIWGVSWFELFVFRLLRSNVFSASGRLVASPLTRALARVSLL